MTSAKPQVNAPIGEMRFALADGGSVTVGQPKERWTMLFVYRGRHCPRCKRFLTKLSDALDDWTADMDVVVV
ncbi:MAG: redoxin domain-containing protein [Pseudomonadota bacterium]